nr:peroxiredoxin-like family protein [Luteolibacter marinus]
MSPGDLITARSLPTLEAAEILLPHPEKLTHLQFRRFAGCPICHLHLRSFIQRWQEIDGSGLAEVVVFHSSREDLLKHHASAPFALVPDPEKKLYREFGVETSLAAVADPRSWWPALKGMLSGSFAVPGKGESPLGLPADFLIRPDGSIAVVKYGRFADDKWSVDELLALAKQSSAT